MLGEKKVITIHDGGGKTVPATITMQDKDIFRHHHDEVCYHDIYTMHDNDKFRSLINTPKKQKKLKKQTMQKKETKQKAQKKQQHKKKQPKQKKHEKHKRKRRR